MSVVAGIETELTPLVWESEELPCESNNHGKSDYRGKNHDDGPGAFYLQMLHECSWLAEGTVYVACAKSAENVRWGTSRSRLINCYDCMTIVPGDSWIRVVGPVGI